MEIAEAFRSLLKREKKESVNRWTYDQFREYLLALTRGPEFLLPSVEYPDEIQLSEDWQEILGRMGEETKDGFERWALVGFKADKRALYLSEISAKGTKIHVPSEVMEETLDRAKSQLHIVNLVGDVHTHPHHPFSLPGSIDFSAGDLYTLLAATQYGQREKSMIMVLEDGSIAAAFRARDTDISSIKMNIFSEESFEKYWYEKNGFRYKGLEEFRSDPFAMIDPRASNGKVNLDIAARHKLVLYKGKINQPLIRQFPQRNRNGKEK